MAERHAACDLDGDGALEIERLKAEYGLCHSSGTADAPLVLAIVEERLLAEPAEGPGLRLPLATWARDRASEGWDAAAVSASVYRGPRHQDGLTVLALRRFLQDVREQLPRLRAVVLVGDFPEAFLVRQFNWPRHDPITLRQGKPDEKAWGGEGGVDYLRSVPEPVALRTDLPLGDLDGNWEQAYRMGPDDLPWVYAVYTKGIATAASEPADDLDEGTLRFADYFFVNDGEYRVSRDEQGHASVEILPPANAECAPEDLTADNPIARPEVWVSRLNARHASVVPDPTIREGEKGLLDAHGMPQRLDFPSADKVPGAHDIWVPSERVERGMLARWFALRHGASIGDYAFAHKPACIGTGWGNAVDDCRAAFPEWKGFHEAGYENVREDVTLEEVVAWLQLPADARSMKAHGDPWGCSWANAPDVPRLEAAVGPAIWNWRKDGAALVPSLGGTPGKLDYAITRSLYESGKTPPAPALWLYTACEGTAPQRGAEVPYSDPAYGRWQGAEGIVFHLGGLALIGRSKVFYDEPSEMWSVLGSGGTMGDVWRHYFDVEALNGEMARSDGIGCKRAYFWCVLGDCTARVPSR